MIILVTLSGWAVAADTADAKLQSKLETMASQHHGKVALWAKNLRTGDTVAINAD